MGLMLSFPVASKGLQRRGNRLMRVGSAEMQGFRNTMEDQHTIRLQLLPEKHGPTAFFGVYDGHNGVGAANYLNENLPDRVAALDDPVNQEAINAIMLDLDLKYHENHGDAGSTAVFAVVQPIKEKGDDGQTTRRYKITVANVGDSRAILIRKEATFLELSHDHKPLNPLEQKRITEAGGRVSMDNRVDGQLAVSRAFGDWMYKGQTAIPQEKQKVIVLPDFESGEAAEGDHLLLCCDGLFERMNAEDVVATIREGLKEFPDDNAKVVARLLDASLEKGSKDNMSAMLVTFADGFDFGKGDSRDEYVAGPFSRGQYSGPFVKAYREDAKRHGVPEDQIERLAAEADKRSQELKIPDVIPAGPLGRAFAKENAAAAPPPPAAESEESTMRKRKRGTDSDSSEDGDETRKQRRKTAEEDAEAAEPAQVQHGVGGLDWLVRDNKRHGGEENSSEN